MRCVGRVVAIVTAVLAASSFWMVADASAQTRTGGYSASGKARFGASPSMKRPVLSRSQQRNRIAQRRARQAVVRANRAFAWPVQANARFDRRRGVYARPATGGFLGGSSYGFAGGFAGNAFYGEAQGAASPVRGGPVSINDIPATAGIPAAPTPEPAFYDIRRERGGQAQLVRRRGARIVELGAAQTGQGDAAQDVTADVAGPRIIRIP